MKTATAKEYAQATARGGQKRQITTRRTLDVYWSDRGTEVASKHEILTRGKITNTTYMVNPAYLPA